MLPGLVQGVLPLLDSSMSPFTQIHMMMVRAPNLGSVSNLASSIVEDELLHVIRNYDDIAEDGVAHGWMNESFVTQVRCRLFDKDGKARFTGGQEEFWNAVERPDETISFYATEADNLLEQLMDNNHDLFLDVSCNYLIENIHVARKLPNLWVLQITGALV